MGLGLWCVLVMIAGLFFGTLYGLWDTVWRLARTMFLLWAAWLACTLLGTLVP